MTIMTKAKMRPYALRWAMLILLLGWLFNFWLPFVVVTENGLHWLNYVIFWGAAWAWLVPFFIWLKQHAHFSRVRLLGTLALLLMLWGILISGAWVVSGRGILPPDPNHYRACDVGRHRHYTCYLPYVELPIADESRYGTNTRDSLLFQWIFTTRIEAEQIGNLPIARVTGFGARIFSAEEIMRGYDAGDP